MKSLLFFITLVLFFPITALSNPVPFDRIQNFHEKRVNALLRNYDLQESVDISVIISPEQMKSLNVYKKNKRFRLPGLLLGQEESSDEESTIGVFEILDSLKDYKRNVTLVKKKHVAEAEISALKAGLTEYLALRESEPVKVENKIFDLASEMKNWRADLKKSVYQSFFKSNLWAWVPILLGLVLVFSVLLFFSLKKSFSSLGDSIEKNGNQAAESTEMQSIDSIEKDEDHSSPGGAHELVESDADQLLEVNPIGIFEKIEDLHSVSQYELFSILWRHFPKVESQISFYEILNSHLNTEQMETFKNIFFEGFKLSPGMRLNGLQSKTVSANEMASLQRSLLLASLTDSHPKREKALSAVYPKYGAKVESVVEASLESFFSVVYFLFPEEVTDFISSSSNPSPELSDKILEHLTGSDVSDEPNDLEVEGFVKFVESASFMQKGGAPLIDQKLLRLVENLPDSVIFNSQKLTEENRSYIMNHLPNLSWVSSHNPERLKTFLLSLKASELVFVSKECRDFSFLIESLDERGQFRVQEKLDVASDINKDFKMSSLRKSIKKYFKPVATQVVEEQVFPNAA